MIMAVYQCELKLVDELGKLNIESLCYKKLEPALKSSYSWCSDIILYGDEEDTCVEVFYCDGVVDEISVRIHVANFTTEILSSIVDFINDNHLFIIYNEKLINATEENLINLIKSSAAFEFCKNSRKFLRNMKTKTQGDSSLF